MLRTARHAKILEIISQKEIETQEELCSELNKLNYVVTRSSSGNSSPFASRLSDIVRNL